MRLGISLPHQQPDGNAVSAAQVMDRARLIERVGFDGIWLLDAVGRGTRPRADPLMTLAVAGAATERIELGTAILQVPLRHPVELAQRLLTLHGLTGGRFVAGLGAGSTLGDFEAVGVDYPSRFRQFASALQTLRGLFNGEQVGSANLHPWPNTLGGPPILIGSWESGIWVRRAAEQFDGWIASGLTSFNAISEGIRRYRDAGGMRAVLGTIVVDLSAPTTHLPDDGPFHLRCGIDAARDRLQRISDLGYDDALLSNPVHTEADLPETDLVTLRSLVPRP